MGSHSLILEDDTFGAFARSRLRHSDESGECSINLHQSPRSMVPAPIHCPSCFVASILSSLFLKTIPLINQVVPKGQAWITGILCGSQAKLPWDILLSYPECCGRSHLGGVHFCNVLCDIFSCA